jgi:hypothetical protein
MNGPSGGENVNESMGQSTAVSFVIRESTAVVKASTCLYLKHKTYYLKPVLAVPYCLLPIA